MSLGAVITLLAGCGGGGEATSTDDEPVYWASGHVLESPEHGPHYCWYLLTSNPPICSGLPLVGWDWDAVEGEESVGGTTWIAASVEGTYDGERFTLTEQPGRPRPPEDRDPIGPACEDPEAIDPSAGVDDTYGGLPGPAQLPELVALWVNQPPDPSEPLSYETEGWWDGPYIVNLVVRPGASAKAEEVLRTTWAGHACIVEWDQPTMTEMDELGERVDEVLTDDNLLGAEPVYRRGVVVAKVIVVRDEDRRAVEQVFGPGVIDFDPILTPVPS